ncbi:Uncharacterised protein [Serratia proteamaculans]|nr:Uncharacterised protein [Serratia proteamaculans]
MVVDNINRIMQFFLQKKLNNNHMELIMDDNKVDDSIFFIAI